MGKHNGKRESFGHSLAIDPWGAILADAGGGAKRGSSETTPAPPPPSIVTCEIDLEIISNIRQRMPIAMHRDDAKFS